MRGAGGEVLGAGAHGPCSTAADPLLHQQAAPLLQGERRSVPVAERSIRINLSTLKDLWLLAATAHIWPAAALVALAAFNAAAIAECAHAPP